MSNFFTVSNDEKKEFARKQYEFLKKVGIEDREKKSRIFKAAGPGQLEEAYEMVSNEEENFKADPFRKLLFYCVIFTIVYGRITKEEAEKLLNHFGFYVPKAHNNNCFFRTIKGAGEFLFDNFCDFTRKELKEIKEGLKKRVHSKENER